MANINYPIFIFFGLAPSIIWLLFYLKKDKYPESSKMILKIFFYGMLSAIPTILIEMGIYDQLIKLNLSPIIFSITSIFLGVAFIEEFLKYLVVRGKILKSSAFDEPVDIMIYMIVAALGFAASENLLIIFSLGTSSLIGNALSISIYRFLGATFLHALCSGTVGYFFALSLSKAKRKGILIITGLSIATILHGLFNFSIIKMEKEMAILIPIIILVGLAIFVGLAFKRLKKMKSTCKIQ